MYPSGSEQKKFLIIVGLLCFTVTLFAQENILERKVQLPVNNIKASRALGEVSRLTGYVFTYDIQILNTERNVMLPPTEAPLSEVLDSITGDSTIKYSVIGRHIILFRDIVTLSPPAEKTDSIYYLTLTGKITDSETSEPLQYATIGIRHRGKGTVTNINGGFVLKVTNQCLDDTLSVSYVGYVNRLIPVKSMAGNVMEIRLDRDFVSIPEIIVRYQDPLNIIRKTIDAIPVNYGTSPALLTGFYREGVYRKKEPQIYSEAVLQIYKSAYARSLLNDQIKVVRSRKIENLDVKDTLAVRLKAGLSSTLALDGMKQLFEFIDPETINNYKFRMTDIVTMEGERAFVVSFEQNEWIEDPMMKGDIYINTDDYGVMLVEFEINPLYVFKTRDSFITRLPKGYSMKPEYIRYRTQYRKIDNRYYLSHVRGDLGFLARGKNVLFNSHFNIFFELAVTNHRLEQVERFEHEELAPVYSVFSRTVTGYDSEFWKDFDFLKPEDDLVEALNQLNVRLGEFGK